MKIKRLELSGFKSFVDKTIIEVPPGITGIVGPNGCGKSNIVDAIRWVLGEQSYKNLRGKSMEDVIFNGSESRSPIGMAEVNVTFDNGDGRFGGVYSNYGEISVGRRLFRSGESEYLINRNVVRLRDIQDIFMDTGVGPRAHYSIIEQGKIGLVLSSKPEDRRILIEEAAGISKYRVRKEAALRRIESTQQNLLRITDVIAEVKRQMEYTRRQAQKAQKHVELKNAALELEARLWKIDYREEHDRYRQYSSDLQNLEGEEEGLRLKITHTETELEKKRLDLVHSEKGIQEVQENLYKSQNRILLLEKDLEHCKLGQSDLAERLLKIAQALEKAGEEAALTEQKLHEVQDGLGIAQEKESRVQFDLEQLESDLASTQNSCEEKAREIEEVRTQIAARVTKISNAETRQSHFAERRREISDQLQQTKVEEEEMGEELQSLRQNLKRNEENIAGAQQLQLELKSKAQARQESFVALDQKRSVMDETLFKTRGELAALKSRLSILRELQSNYEGLNEGVRSIMLHKRTAEGAHLGIDGLVADLISVPKEYERAAEAVLGERLQYVVVRSQAEGVESVSYLTRQAQGRGSFVPLTLRGISPAEDSPDSGQDGAVIGSMAGFVKASPDYGDVVRYLFGDVSLVKSLDDALRLWKQNQGKRSYVTLAGEVVDVFGVVSGGQSASKTARADVSKEDFGDSTGLLQRNRIIQDLGVEISRLEAHLVAEEKQAAELVEHFSRSKRDLEILQKDSHEEEIRLIAQQTELQKLREECRRHEESLQKILERRRNAEGLLDQLGREAGDVAKEIEDAANARETLSRRMAEEKTRESEQRAYWESLKTKATQFQVTLAEAREQITHREQELRRLENEVATQKNQIKDFQKEIAGGREKEKEFIEKLQVAEAEINNLIRESRQLAENLKQKREVYQSAHQNVSKEETALREARRHLEDLTSRSSQAKVEVAEAKMRLERLESHIRETQKVAPELLIEEALRFGETAQTAEASDETAIQQARGRLDELQTQLAGLGEVNLAAITELDELTKRHVFLNRQKEDLDRSIESLEKTIQKVNRTSRELFRETFDAVNEKFQGVFPRLFGGGKASLLLTDENNLLETGIDILCQPPGKKVQNVSLLSGGEKALASICLILAIFLIKPSPFCLLDEVDAPLDDANISRFNELLHELARESQLLLITHNRHTMEIADHLYGVTMEEPGVSRMVSVRMQ